MTTSRYNGKDRLVAVALAYFFGIFGGHLFYLGDMKKGLLYFVFCWTTIPFFLGLYDGFKYYRHPEWFSSVQETTVDKTVGTDEEGVVEDNETFEPDSLPDDAAMRVSGANGQVTLYEDRLEISRDDIGMLHKMQHGFKGDKEIPYESITSIQLRKPSSVTRGYIQFGQSGFSESDDGLMDATSDENTVLFDKESLSEFQELREKVRELKKGDVEESTGSMDGAMEKLRERYADGEIDEEEYEQRKEILQG